MNTVAWALVDQNGEFLYMNYGHKRMTPRIYTEKATAIEKCRNNFPTARVIQIRIREILTT